MSALTDFFTSLANKIRSKLGTSTTYTPAQAVSAIDDVYTKGVTDTKVGTAVAGDVLSGKTFTNSSSVGASGSMTNNGAVSQALNCGGSYTVPAGYHNGSGKVTANSLASQTGVDSGKTAVTAGTMVSGYQGWVNGSKITGTFAGQEKTVTAGTSAASVTPDSGKYLTKVTYNPTPSQSKSASPSTSAQTISPDSGKLLSSVSISAISPQRAAGTAAVASGKDSTGPYVYFPYGWYPSGGNDRQYVRMTAAQAVAACPSQSKSTTSSRTAQTISPDSGNLLSSVSIAKYPDASGTFTPSSSQYNSSAADMGATNNLRYVNTAVCYSEGQKSVYTSQRQIRIDSYGAVLFKIRLSGFCSKIKFQGFWYEGDAQQAGDTIDFIGGNDSVVMSKPISYFNTEWKSLDIGQIAYYMQFSLPSDGDNHRVVQTDYIEYN